MKFRVKSMKDIFDSKSPCEGAKEEELTDNKDKKVMTWTLELHNVDEIVDLCNKHGRLYFDNGWRKETPIGIYLP